MKQHVLDIAYKHKVILRWIPEWKTAESFVGGGVRFAIVPEIGSVGDYLVALHELGHVLDKTARRGQDDYSVTGWITTEGAAWAWAAEHADPELTGPLDDEVKKLLADCWLSNMTWGVTRPTDYSRIVEGQARFSHEPPHGPVRHSPQTADDRTRTS